MPQARKHQISLSDTSYYHCVSRCVRRAYLCGKDPVTGRSYEHRRQWVEERILFLTTVFAIEVCAYAVMSNHTHVVLHVNSDRAQHWNDKEVLLRWHQLHKGTLLSQQFAGETSAPLTEAEQATLQATLAVYRHRLSDISWFMRELNEPIARQANHEDNCTGHFWEGRFKSQALLDEQALAACMAYVDLNPIRAKLAHSIATSHHTSIKRRLSALKEGQQPAALMPFVTRLRDEQPHGLPFELIDYLTLVDLSGRIATSDKYGIIEAEKSPFLQRLGLDALLWLRMACQFETTFRVAAGQRTTLQHFKRKRRRSSAA